MPRSCPDDSKSQGQFQNEKGRLSIVIFVLYECLCSLVLYVCVHLCVAPCLRLLARVCVSCDFARVLFAFVCWCGRLRLFASVRVCLRLFALVYIRFCLRRFGIHLHLFVFVLSAMSVRVLCAHVCVFFAFVARSVLRMRCLRTKVHLVGVNVM